MATISLEHVSKTYENGVNAVEDFNLEVAEGEFMVLVGPSGCGKTTALRMVAGLEEISGGTLKIGDRVVNDVSPRERDVAMVFQNYALYPHMTVAENIGFALKLSKTPKEEIRSKVDEAAQILGLTEYLNKKPGQLSGGQRQRVAMGRAIVREPAVFLMDEPLSNLDAKLRVQMRTEIARIQRRLGVATIYVTHDQTEAMTMGDRVAVMRSGSIQQCDSPQALYDAPVNMFVASFMGSPPMNLYEGSMSQDGHELIVGDQHLEFPDRVSDHSSPLREYFGKPVIVGIRPEHLHDPAAVGEVQPGRSIQGQVDLVEALGAERLIHFALNASRVGSTDVSLTGEDIGAEGLDAGELGASTKGVGIARVEATSKIAVGERATFVVDVELIHLFDPESGIAIA